MNKDLFKMYRQTLGLSQEEFGNKLGITKQMVCYIERGNRPITPKVKRRFYAAFNVTKEELNEIMRLQSLIKVGK